MKTTRVITRSLLILIPCGLLINYLFAQLVLLFRLPLFLDSVGTVLVAALGGYLPGIIVGFFSNVLNSLTDPITLYYGVLSTMIAVAAAWLASMRVYESYIKTLLSSLVYAIIGGGLGSVITWMLYGFSFGSGISAPFALWLNSTLGMSQFSAQFSADMLIDLLDKAITVTLVFFALRLIPYKVLLRLPMSAAYRRRTRRRDAEDKRFYRKHSLRSEVVLLILCTSLVLGTLATAISSAIYNRTSDDKYVQTATGVATLVSSTVDGDRVEGYLATLVEDEEYADTVRELTTIRASFPEIEFIYVYQIREDGCHVVFDLDTDEVEAGRLGDFVPSEDAFADYYDILLGGGRIEPVISKGEFGWLLTAYEPILNSSGRCVAYAAADISMDDVINDRYVFVIRMISLLFGASIIIVAAAVWFAENRLVMPINSMTAVADRFAFDSEHERVQQQEDLREIEITTGDEIESLYHALNKTAADVVQYISSINQKAEIIARMQGNIIVSFADMVENRDLNTGEHIRHTAEYVRIIAEQLKTDGRFAEQLTPEYIEDIVRCAPLHDIGKIRISDVLLNKPGRLTPEEFELMKTHAASGRDILRGVMSNIESDSYLASACDMAAAHHERWDGSGYPAGLSGEEIPLSARIMAVADVFDALVSKRSYKEPMSFDEAFNVIVSESGTHFDPTVVEAFTRSRDRLRKYLDL